MAPFDGKPSVGTQVFRTWTFVVVITDAVVEVLGLVVPAMQSQRPKQGHLSAGSTSHAAEHDSSVPPNCRLRLVARQLSSGLIEVMIGVVVVVVVVLVLPLVLVLGATVVADVVAVVVAMVLVAGVGVAAVVDSAVVLPKALFLLHWYMSKAFRRSPSERSCRLPTSAAALLGMVSNQLLYCG